jgi:hypothetical protein
LVKRQAKEYTERGGKNNALSLRAWLKRAILLEFQAGGEFHFGGLQACLCLGATGMAEMATHGQGSGAFL